MRLTTRIGLVLATGLAITNPFALADDHPDEGMQDEHMEAMHEEHEAEGETCPMVMAARKASVADLVADYDGAAKKLISLAEAIPAEKYGWAPSDEVRTVSQVFMHVVGANYMIPMGMGAAPPEGLQMDEGGPMATMQKWEQEVTDKDAVIAKLKASVDYAEGALTGMDERDPAETVDLFGPMSLLRYMLVVQSHTHEHLGQMIAYARSIGVVPPWSRPAKEEG